MMLLSVFIAVEKKFVPQYCQKKKGFIGGADTQSAQATKNELPAKYRSESGIFIE